MGPQAAVILIRVLHVPEKSQQLCLNAPLQRSVKFSPRDTAESTEFHLPPDTPGLCHSASPLLLITNKTFVNINKDPQMYLSEGIFWMEGNMVLEKLQLPINMICLYIIFEDS